MLVIKGEYMKRNKLRTIFLATLVAMLSLIIVSCSQGSNNNDQNVDLPPIPPIAPQITYLTETSTTVEWLSMGTNAVYNVYKAPSRNGNYTMVATTTDTFFTDQTEGTNIKPSKASYYRITTMIGDVETKPTLPASQETLMFGDYTYIFNPDDNPDEINRELAEIFQVQEYAQFDIGRYAVMFKPDKEYKSGNFTGKANYNNVNFKLGFYTEAMGLGKLPTDTTVGGLRVDANWLGVPGATGDSNATCNFWRGVSNFTVNPQILSGQTKNTLWAVSQAAPMRRMQINGNLQLTTTTGTKNWGSGGYISDTRIANDQILDGYGTKSQNATGVVSLMGQQQFYFRNMEAVNFTGGQWNMVFQGVDSNISTPKDSGKTTIIPNAPVIQEKPFIFLDENGDYKVFVPGLRHDASGLSWGDGKPNNGMGVGTIKDIDDFYITRYLYDDETTINKALSEGKNILFTPGVYYIDSPLIVSNPNTIIMGIGMATIYNRNNTSSMIISSKGLLDGIVVSGLIFDAGTKGSPCLLKVGADRLDYASADAPILLADLFFRVGGDIIGMADTCVEINVDNTIGDDFWVWRADHGAEVTWLKNIAENGLIVNGNDVTMYALMCEHFREYQTIWNGENGRLYFYQSELPYDVINQESWIAPNGANGYASYKVSDHVRVHEAWGLGVYSCFTRTGEPPQPPLSGYADGLTYVFSDSAIEVPNAPGVKIHNACTVYLAADNSLRGKPSIKNVVNNYGGAIFAPVNRAFITEFCDPIDELPQVQTIDGKTFNTGKYSVPQQVKLVSAIDGEIWYTLDSSSPLPSNPAAIKYDGEPILIGDYGRVVVLSVMIVNGDSLSQVKQISVVVSDDLAVFQPTKASSSNSGNIGPSGAVNGITDKTAAGSSTSRDRWQAASAFNEWWAVDLGGTHNINDIKITWDSPRSCAYTFTVYVSSDESAWDNPADLSRWTAIWTVENQSQGETINDMRINQFEAQSVINGRYLMIVGVNTAGPNSNGNTTNSYPFAIWGFEVLGN